MSHILAIDPGAKTGWCLYAEAARRVISSGIVDEHRLFLEELLPHATSVVIERPKGYGPTYPQVVDAAYVAGRLVGEIETRGRVVHELTRLDVRKALTAATLGEVSVRNDASAWAALLLIHGGEHVAKKGGPLHGVKAHARAALAVAVAFALRNESSATKEGATA